MAILPSELSAQVNLLLSQVAEHYHQMMYRQVFVSRGNVGVAGMDISPMPGMHAPGSPAADSDADMELSSPDPMSSVQSLGFALELPAECIQLMVSLHPSQLQLPDSQRRLVHVI